MKDKERKDYNLLIGKDVHWDFVFLDDCFDHWDGFKGMTGTIVQFHTQDEWENELQDYIDNDGLLDIWKEWVYHWNITQSYSDWCDDVKDLDGISALYDTGYNHYSWLQEWCEIASEKDEVEYDSDYTNCVWGWRCFERKMLEDSYWEWTVEENFKKFKSLYIRYELPNDEREDVRKAKERLKKLVLAGYFNEVQVDEYLVKIKVPKDARKFLQENEEKVSEREAKRLAEKIDKDDTTN